MNLILLQSTDLILAVGLVAIAISLAAWQGLGLVAPILLASGRALLQLLILGYALALVFTWKNPWVVLGAVVLMVTIAAISARNRISKTLPSLMPIVWMALFISTAATVGYVNLLVIRPQLWYDPQYVVPLVGLGLGSAMNGAVLAGERFVRTLRSSRNDIETHLCLGATPKQAIAAYRVDAVKSGVVPTINSMMVIGIVQLPTWMGGQLLSGVQPLEAASYQILLMFMLTVATLLATLLVIEGLARQFFTSAAQLKEL
ncbi:MAG: iron export ABC transporter permease subunit FetB [Aphanocapsa sp. GSE-SYN-MK-11-07L]|jgi:putative ABC transport system permease protein|nr:iron export ABC transporter permease subunit FetB [Aphanocapsa sp. GSE-SYN-MK-11-07L]